MIKTPYHKMDSAREGEIFSLGGGNRHSLVIPYMRRCVTGAFAAAIASSAVLSLLELPLPLPLPLPLSLWLAPLWCCCCFCRCAIAIAEAIAAAIATPAVATATAATTAARPLWPLLRPLPVLAAQSCQLSTRLSGARLNAMSVCICLPTAGFGR